MQANDFQRPLNFVHPIGFVYSLRHGWQNFQYFMPSKLSLSCFVREILNPFGYCHAVHFLKTTFKQKERVDRTLQKSFRRKSCCFIQAKKGTTRREASTIKSIWCNGSDPFINTQSYGLSYVSTSKHLIAAFHPAYNTAVCCVFVVFVVFVLFVYSRHTPSNLLYLHQ